MGSNDRIGQIFGLDSNIGDLPDGDQKAIRGWCYYDWAKSAFETSIVVAMLRQRGGGLVFIAVAHDAAERLGLPFMDAVLDSAAADFPALSALRAHDLPYDSRSSFSLWLNARDTYTGITDRDRARTVAAFGELAAAGLEPDAAQLLLGEGFGRTLSFSLAIIEFEGYFGRFSGINPIIFSKDVDYGSSQHRIFFCSTECVLYFLVGFICINIFQLR